MHFIYSLMTLGLQSIGQIFSLLVGWVIAVHLGKVPTRQKFILSAMGGISLIWAAMALSLTFPPVRRVLSAVTQGNVPVYIKLIIPLAGLGWICLPLLNGVLALYFHKVKRSGLHLFLGYKYTPGLALALLLMLVSLPVLILPPIILQKRREHIPVMIASNTFEPVLDSICSLLQKQGMDVEIKAGTIWRRSPIAILALFAHDLLGEWTKKPARMLRGQGLQLIVYPTDIVIEGKPEMVVKARNYLAKGLTFCEAYFTWDGESHLIEAKLNAVRKAAKQIPKHIFLGKMAQLEAGLDSALIPFAEWESLYRQLLQIRVEYSCNCKD